MRIERRTPQQAGPAFGAIFGAVLVASGALATFWLGVGLPRPVCPLREWTGIPCPTCGSTRMVESLLAGEILQAAAWNPLVFLGLSAVASWAVVSVVRLVFGLPVWRVVLGPRERVALRLAAVAALVAGWIYLVWRGV